MSVTPGPNCLMLAVSGINFGFQRTIPHMLGILVGFMTLMLAAGLGFGALVNAAPVARQALTAAGVGYILWLAWRIAMTKSLGDGQSTGQPLTITEAALFQLINVKGLLFALTTAAVYVRPAQFIADSVLVSAILGAVLLPSAALWAGFGAAMRGVLDTPARVRAFNIIMAALLALTVIPILRS